MQENVGKTEYPISNLKCIFNKLYLLKIQYEIKAHLSHLKKDTFMTLKKCIL